MHSHVYMYIYIATLENKKENSVGSEKFPKA